MNPPPGYEFDHGVWVLYKYFSYEDKITLEKYIDTVSGTEVYFLKDENDNIEKLGPITFNLILEKIKF